MNIQKGDLTEIKSGIIVHQVNCFGMGRGLARALYTKWPAVKEHHAELVAKSHPLHLLGQAQFVIIDRHLSVVNCFSQFHYGADGKRYTDYGAIKMAFDSIRRASFGQQHYFPLLFGAGLGGGDPKIVQELIKMYFPEAILIDNA